jgi:hypothetical protein
MDDFVPVSPGFVQEDEDEEDAGWGSVSREEARQGRESSGDDDDDDEEDEGMKENGKGVFIDLDAVAREEADVWGDRDD